MTLIAEKVGNARALGLALEYTKKRLEDMRKPDTDTRGQVESLIEVS